MTILLDNKADPRLLDKNGLTPYEDAADENGWGWLLIVFEFSLTLILYCVCLGDDIVDSADEEEDYDDIVEEENEDSHDFIA